MPDSAAPVRRLPFLSDPAWDLSDEEINEWKQTPGLYFAAYTAECIRDGKYDNGQEIYPPGSLVYKDISRSAVDRVMGILAERGMVRKSGSAWHAIAPGRLEPSVRRAVAVLLDRRTDLPPALAAELDSWNLTLDTLEGHRGAHPSQAVTGMCGPAGGAGTRDASDDRPQHVALSGITADRDVASASRALARAVSHAGWRHGKSSCI